MIGDGALAPEDLLQEAPLGEMLGMSRTPVREALRRVEANGLAYGQGRFLRVRGPTAEEISESLVLLGLLEPRCASSAAETAHGQAMAAGLLIHPDLSGTCHPAGARTEIAVNRFLSEACSNSTIGQQVYELRCRLLPVSPVLRAEPVQEALNDMLSAISKGDQDKAGSACRARLADQETALARAGLLGTQPHGTSDTADVQT